VRPLSLPVPGPRVPRRGNRVLRVLGRAVLRLSGWRLSGELPNAPKLIILAAPHSSLWDGVVGIAAAFALSIRAHWMGKHTLFRGWKGRMMRFVGGLPVDRGRAHGAVGDVAREFASREALWLAIAPEGTRKVVPRWKTGFWHIARAANVPVFQVAFHYPEKRIVIGPLYWVGRDLDGDVARVQTFYRPWRGRGGKRAVHEPTRCLNLADQEPSAR
jgi:1-acyl-sn-glycerol-3-phosphate acyltransferase